MDSAPLRTVLYGIVQTPLATIVTRVDRLPCGQGLATTDDTSAVDPVSEHAPR